MADRPRNIPISWSGLVERGVFEQMILSATGVPITLLLLKEFEFKDQYPWLALNAVLSLVCFFFAFVRIWKTNKEERKTAAVWEAVFKHAPTGVRTLNLMLETPYLFLLFMLPYFSVSYQFFLIAVVLFYLIDCGWNLLFLKYVETYYRAHHYSPVECAACPFRPYFRSRQALTIILLALAVIASVFSWIIPWQEQRDLYLTLGILVMLMLITGELIVDAFINRSFHLSNIDDEHVPSLTLDEIEAPDRIDADQARLLETIYAEAFSTEERPISMEEMIAETGSSGRHLVLIQIGGETVGFHFYEVDPQAQAAYLWYLAIHANRRGGGIGSAAIRALLNRLRDGAFVPRLVLFESHAPPPDAQDSHPDMRRLAFYRRLGAHRVGGIRYRLPAFGRPDESISYEVLFFLLARDIEPERIRRAVTSMAGSSMPQDHPLMGELRASLADMFIVAPDDGALRVDEE